FSVAEQSLAKGPQISMPLVRLTKESRTWSCWPARRLRQLGHCTAAQELPGILSTECGSAHTRARQQTFLFATAIKTRYASLMDSREAFVALNMIDHVGPVRVRQLLTYLGDAPAILAASTQQLMRVQCSGEETAETIASWEKHVDLANELKRIREFGCHVLI